ncbi:MAG: hypothetical protein K9G48_09935 [Reyranella sp.]|jgi:hypothetical protein|nr:hypothetical protein [Reyranella sp.]
MKFDDVRRVCRMIEATSPSWVRVLFAASLGALLLVELDRRFYTLGAYTVLYINLNYLIAAGTGVFLAGRTWGAWRRDRLSSR